MKYAFLTVDLEEFDSPIDFGGVVSHKDMFEVSRKGCVEMLKILNSFKVRSTFFTTTAFAKENPELIKKIVSGGHEIAFHGNVHKTDLPDLNEPDMMKYFRKHKKELEKLSETKIVGFRNPKMRTPPYEVLKKNGIKYDSSLHPTYIPGFYNNFLKPTSIYDEHGILEIPVSVVPLVRFPFSWLWFRNFGVRYSKLCTKLASYNEDFVNLYFHPWEFVDISSFNMPVFIKRNSGNNMKRTFSEYIEWLIKQDFDIIPIKEYIQ